jgi:hypothetical protein
LESAVTLTKALRWDIQSLGIRLSKAAAAEEHARHGKSCSKSRSNNDAELRFIIDEIKRILLCIEDAVPLINLAITTSGANLSTTLPATVSPSRLLQASTFLTAGDTQYSIDPSRPVQIGPTFILSVYMLFSGHAYRAFSDERSVRDTTWKEAIHKTSVKLVRVPLAVITNRATETTQAAKPDISHIGTTREPIFGSIEGEKYTDSHIAGDGKANEYAYRLEIVEDLDDDRVHSEEDGDPQPSAFDDVLLAGIREFFPIHEVSKIFYADTSKILNIGSEGETNSPVLLLKRDVNAVPPRRMMENSEEEQYFQDPSPPTPEEEGEDRTPSESGPESESENEGDSESGNESDDSQADIDRQLQLENSIIERPESQDNKHDAEAKSTRSWRFPPNLDPEWIAFEVYTEPEFSTSDSEPETDINNDSAYISARLSSSNQAPDTAEITKDLSHLHLENSSDSSKSSPAPTRMQASTSTPSPSPYLKQHRTSRPVFSKPSHTATPSPFGPIRSSLSLLEMLIRLTALQQFQQASHLAIPDELLTFFLEESSTTGAGGDGEERRQKRWEARQKVGFDPYDESPIKHHGEEYQYQNGNWNGSGGYGARSSSRYQRESSYFSKDYDNGPLPEHRRRGTPEPWLLRHEESSVELRRKGDRGTVEPSSPTSPYIPKSKGRAKRDPLARVQNRDGERRGSPLGRGASEIVEGDSSLGTSPGSLRLLLRKKVENGDAEWEKGYANDGEKS